MAKYTCYLSRPVETNLSLQLNDRFFRPRGKLLWGTPKNSNYSWEDFMKSVSLDDNDPFKAEIEKRTRYGYEFTISQLRKIFRVAADNPLPEKYILGMSKFDNGDGYVCDSYIIDFTQMKRDGYAGIEMDFDSFGGVPTVYAPWSFSSIAVWDASVISNIKQIK